MGTTTFFLRLNDCAKPLHKMSKKELAELNNVTPYADKAYKGGWLVSPEFTPIESLLLRAELLQRKRVSHLEISSKLL